MKRSFLFLTLLAALPAVTDAQSTRSAFATEASPALAPRQPHASELMVARQARRDARVVEAHTMHQAATTAVAPTVDLDAPRRADGFASSGFAQFMSSPAGRVLRVVAGAGMIAGGIAADSDGGTVLAGLGAVPLLAGTFDFCVLSPLFGGPFWGRDIRAAK